MTGLRGVAHGDVGFDAVVVSAADAFAFDVAKFHEVGDDALGGSFGDADALGDVTGARVGIAVEAEKDLGVVREEPPGLMSVFGA